MTVGSTGVVGDGTVARALRLLDCFAEAEEWPLRALSRRLNLPLSTTHRLLHLCRTEGFVATAGRGNYRAGLALYRLGGALTQQFPLRRTAAPLLNGLAGEFGHTALLALLDRNALRMFFAARADAATPTATIFEEHRLGTLCWGAGATALLAHLPDADIQTIIARNEPSPRDGRAFDPAELRRRLATIRSAGYAISFGERVADCVAIGVPFFDPAGVVVGTLSLAVPESDYRESDRGRYLVGLRQAASAMSACGRP